MMPNDQTFHTRHGNRDCGAARACNRRAGSLGAALSSSSALKSSSASVVTGVQYVYDFGPYGYRPVYKYRGYTYWYPVLPYPEYPYWYW